MAGRPGNVGLVAKVVHHPSLQKELLDAAFDIKMGDQRSWSSLMLAIYRMAVLSLNDCECMDYCFRATQEVLLER